MNAGNFHTFSENKPYVFEVPVMEEHIANYDDYDIIIAGNPHNQYSFELKNLNTNDTVICTIKEAYILNWNIKTGCLSRNFMKDEFVFDAIGYIHWDNDDDDGKEDFEYDEFDEEYDVTLPHRKYLQDQHKVRYEIMNIKVVNTCGIKKYTSSPYDLENNPIFTWCAHLEFRNAKIYGDFVRHLLAKSK